MQVICVCIHVCVCIYVLQYVCVRWLGYGYCLSVHYTPSMATYHTYHATHFPHSSVHGFGVEQRQHGGVHA